MKGAVIWIDRETARLFLLSDEKMERKNLEVHMPEHHTHGKDASDRDRKEHKLFAAAAKELGAVDRVLILGPGVAKHHFKTYLEEHYPKEARKVVGLETVDHPTDGQIAAYTKKLFAEAC